MQGAVASPATETHVVSDRLDDVSLCVAYAVQVVETAIGRERIKKLLHHISMPVGTGNVQGRVTALKMHGHNIKGGVLTYTVTYLIAG